MIFSLREATICGRLLDKPDVDLCTMKIAFLRSRVFLEVSTLEILITVQAAGKREVQVAPALARCGD